MPRGVKVEREYTGKALETYNRIQELTEELKALKEQLKIDYKEQVSLEKEAAKKRKQKEFEDIIKLYKESGVTFDQIKEFLEGK